MSPTILSAAWSATVKLFLSQKVLSSLYNKFRRGSLESRAAAVNLAADSLLKREQAMAVRVKTLESLKDLMSDAGFSDEKIQAEIGKGIRFDEAAAAFETVLQFLDTGKIRSVNFHTVGEVDAPRTIKHRPPQPKKVD